MCDGAWRCTTGLKVEWEHHEKQDFGNWRSSQGEGGIGGTLLSASSIGDGLAEAVIRHIRLGAGVRRQDGKVSRSTVATSSERLCGR